MSRPFPSVTVVCVLLAFSSFYVYGRAIWVPAFHAVVGPRTVADVLVEFGPVARDRMNLRFKTAGVAYPPDRITMLAVKDAALLELWAGPETAPVYVHSYPIRALSGVAAPKLREGDRQVPEGTYQIEGLNPNSSYHLSMKLNYPNEFDLQHAKVEGRDEPGTNIFIHGRSVSIGCLAMGDEAIEELFVLTSDVGRANVEVVISPSDPRVEPLVATNSPLWVADLYEGIASKFARYKK